MSDSQQSITVTGHGSAAATPDRFTITIGIEAAHAAVRDAYAQAGTAMGAVHEVLKSRGVDPNTISSSSLDVRADTRWQEGVGTIVTGYTVSSTLSVTLKYGADAENIIAAVVDTGNNTIRLNGMTPVVSDPAPAQEAARSAAWADALAAAEHYARLTGRALGNVRELAEVPAGQGGPRPMMARAAMAMDSAAMPIAPGQSEVNISVHVTWDLI